jgi:hypothetical protein
MERPYRMDIRFSLFEVSFLLIFYFFIFFFYYFFYFFILFFLFFFYFFVFSFYFFVFSFYFFVFSLFFLLISSKFEQAKNKKNFFHRNLTTSKFPLLLTSSNDGSVNIWDVSKQLSLKYFFFLPFLSFLSYISSCNKAESPHLSVSAIKQTSTHPASSASIIGISLNSLLKSNFIYLFFNFFYFFFFFHY